MAKQKTILQEFEKVRQSKTLMSVGILLLFILFGWTMTGVFMTQQKTVITAEQKNLINPLQPVIDTATIDQLDARKFYNAQELEGFTIYKQLSNDSGEKFIVPIELNVTDIEDQVSADESDESEPEQNEFSAEDNEENSPETIEQTNNEPDASVAEDENDGSVQ